MAALVSSSYWMHSAAVSSLGLLVVAPMALVRLPAGGPS
jgi:hypothetical protein